MAGIAAREKAQRNSRRRDGAGENGADDISSGLPGVPQGVSRKTKQKRVRLCARLPCLETPEIRIFGGNSDFCFFGKGGYQWLCLKGINGEHSPTPAKKIGRSSQFVAKVLGGELMLSPHSPLTERSENFHAFQQTREKMTRGPSQNLSRFFIHLFCFVDIRLLL